MDKKEIKQIKSEIEKFVVNKEDDLIDIVNKISATDADKVILTFTEQTDILISPINFKVLLETADEHNKAIIAQIVQNPVGVRNAKDAGITVTEATGTILEEYWKDAERGLRSRTRSKEDKLHSSNMRYKPMEEENSIGKILEEEHDVTSETSQPKPETIREKSEFQKKIEATFLKSKNNLEKKEGKIIEEGGLTLALDQDITETNKQTFKNNRGENKPSLIGKDLAFFKDFPEEDETPSFDSARDRSEPVPVRVRDIPSSTGPFVQFFKNLGEKISSAPLKKIGIRILAPILAVLVIAFWLVYELTPLVKATVYIESKPVSVEKVFNGDFKANEFNYENSIVPIKKEEATKSVSGTVTPTGKAFRGNKAEGVVTVKYWGAVADLPKTIAAGTIFTANTGETFELSNNLTVGDDGSFLKQNVAVRATQVGEEYNLPSGKTFAIQGYNQTTEFSAENSSAFAGGSKEQYTVLAQTDVDKIVKDIKPGAIDEVKSELEGRNDNGWEIIPTTLKVDSEGAPKTDIPVGAEADIVNVTIEVKGSSIYFKKGELESKMDEVLTKSAEDQKLFEESGDIKLELDEDIKKEITVEEAKDEKIKIKVVASGEVKPKIEKNEIIKKLQGKDWESGVKILKDMKYTDKKTEYTFNPEYFPDWLKYFPSRQGRIVVEIKHIYR